MPTYIKLTGGRAAVAEDAFTWVADDEPLPPGDVVISLTRFQADGDRLLSEGRSLGVRLTSEEAVEDLAYNLPRLSLVQLEFPKFRDGRAFTGARLLRERFGYEGEIRAVGDVLREQAGFMARCGFDGFEPADGASAQEWQAATQRFRHVYQRAADAGRPLAYQERGGA